MHSSIFLSILIPVYNWDVGPLLKKLHEQCQQLPDDLNIEIIVVDDGSEQKFDNRIAAETLELVHYYEFDANKGRPAARNQLIKLAKGNFVLFLDADMMPDRKNFVQRYIEIAEMGSDIVCGGISYLQYEQQDPSVSFYLYKSRKTEVLPAARRNRTPWRYLFTSNIMLRHDIVKKVSFDQRFEAYGFEDIEWGLRLAKAYNIEHIDNTCTHLGVMQKEEVFHKMRESIPNFFLLHTLHPLETKSIGAIRYARLLRHLPNWLLSLMDAMLNRLQFLSEWNGMLYFVFQADKVILLARHLSKNRGVVKG